MASDPPEGETLSAEEPGGFTQVPDSLLLNCAITDGAYRLYAVLKHHARSSNGAYPGRPTLATELGVKSVRTVDNRLEELRLAGYVKKTPRYRSRGGQSTNHYHLLFYPNPRHTAPELYVDPTAEDTSQGQVEEPAPGEVSEPDDAPTTSRPDTEADPTEGVQPVAPRNELHGAADCAGPEQNPARERSTSPSSTNHPQPSPSTGDAGPRADAGGGEDELLHWADAVIAHLPAGLYPQTRSQTAQMRQLLASASDLAIIPAAELADRVARIRELPEVVTHPVGLLRARLGDIAPPRRPRTPMPAWCGECDERTRQLWNPDTDVVRRCSTCHPRRTTNGGS